MSRICPQRELASASRPVWAARTAAAGARAGDVEPQVNPVQQADEQEGLPEAPDIDIFPALVAEPEIGRQAHLLHHGKPLAGKSADHDQHREEHHHRDPAGHADVLERLVREEADS